MLTRSRSGESGGLFDRIRTNKYKIQDLLLLVRYIHPSEINFTIRLHFRSNRLPTCSVEKGKLP